MCYRNVIVLEHALIVKRQKVRPGTLTWRWRSNLTITLKACSCDSGRGLGLCPVMDRGPWLTSCLGPCPVMFGPLSHQPLQTLGDRELEEFGLIFFILLSFCLFLVFSFFWDTLHLHYLKQITLYTHSHTIHLMFSLCTVVMESCCEKGITAQWIHDCNRTTKSMGC